jgi:hypothetical protein
MSEYIKRREISEINDLMLHLKTRASENQKNKNNQNPKQVEEK